MENENKFIVKFSTPLHFEGNEYCEIDLSGIQDLNTLQLLEADKLFAQKGFVDVLKELSTGYCLIIAHLVANKPFEFFTNLKANEAMKIKNVVADFLFR